MTTLEFFRKLASKYLWLNILAVVALVVSSVVLLAVLTKCYTRHGEEIKVPDMVRHNYEAMAALCDDQDLIIEINDSTYDPRFPAGTILKQSPLPGEMVKPGHVIYVTINSLTIPTLTIPDIINNSSSREAVAKLKTMNFKIGPTEFIPGEQDLVLGIKCNGRQLKTGDKVTINDEIILQVGNGDTGVDENAENYMDPTERYVGGANNGAGSEIDGDLEPEATDPNANSSEDFEELVQ